MGDTDRRGGEKHSTGRQLRARDTCRRLAEGAGRDLSGATTVCGRAHGPRQQQTGGTRRKRGRNRSQLGGPGRDGLGERGAGCASTEMSADPAAAQRPAIAVGDLAADLIA
jgi:hypothetical protein